MRIVYAEPLPDALLTVPATAQSQVQTQADRSYQSTVSQPAQQTHTTRNTAIHQPAQMHKILFPAVITCMPETANPTAQKDLAIEHRMKRQKRVEHDTDEARAAHQLEREIDEIVRLLPDPVRVHMLGGPSGMAQVPDVSRQDNIIRRLLRKRAGSEGAQLASVRSMLCTARTYAATQLGMPIDSDRTTRAKLDNAIFPMTTTLAHELIASEDARARKAKAGSQSGATVGARTRDAILFAANRLLWPIDIHKASLESAAEPAQKCVRNKAGTFPIAAKCFLEALASEQVAPDVPTATVPIVVWYARALLAGCIDQSLRVGESVRTKMSPDPIDPNNVMHGTGYLSKDSAPIAIWAPAYGVLGRYHWWPEFSKALSDSALFPVWTGPKSNSSILSATAMKYAKPQAKPQLRQALKDILSLSPLGYTAQDLDAMHIKGHSAHATPSEWARQLLTYPTLKFELPSEYQRGFTQTEVNALGHWSRDAETKAEAAKARAIAIAAPDQRRRAIAMATADSIDTARNTAMQEYYGQPGASGNRFSERDLQIRTRLRLAKIVGIAVQYSGGWRRLPRGQADLQIISSVAIQ